MPFRVGVYKEVLQSLGAYSQCRQGAGVRCQRAAMGARLDIVMVALLCVLRAAAPARFPSWWDEQPRGPEAESAGSARADGEDVQVVYLPALLPREAQSAADRQQDVPVHYSFDAFGRNFELELVPNRRLVSPQFRVWSERGQEAPLSGADASCHFLHAGPGAVAALSACRDHTLHGLIVMDNSTYEVRPLPLGAGRADNGDDRTAHVIRRAPPPPAPMDDARPLRPRARRPRTPFSLPRPPKLGPASYTIEIALFLDEAAYKIFYPFLNYNEADLRDMLLAYINGVQALYQHSSLGTHIQLSLVRLTLLRAQPPSLPPHAERGRLLDSFCAYQRSLNVEDDDDPQHWDMALLLSGLDFYSEEGGRRNGVTMGLAPVGGVCLPAHACVVSEFGTTDVLGRPYPSAGFTSVYILAHEIGHNLGMHHDGTGNACARDGYIMSPSRGTNGEATWSTCSAKVVADLQWATCLLDGGDDETPEELRHERFGGAPGVIWGAKKQCEILLRDSDAAPSPGAPTAGHCAQLACRSPHRAGFYYAGPALPGTPCGTHMWCQGGECVASGVGPEVSSQAPGAAKPGSGGTGSGSGSTGDSNTGGSNTDGSGNGGWSGWSSGTCRSGCTSRARGFRERRRSCPAAAVCEGASYDVVLCDDTKVCGKKRRVSASELASRKCAEYAAMLPELDPRGGGLQAPHDSTRMWMGCAIFCRRASGGGFYAPRVELNDAGLDPYFPDGTWCHHDGSQDYYCLQHHCLPENFKMTAQWHIWELPSEDISGSFNARARSAPDDSDMAAAIRRYFSLDEGGTPLTRAALPPYIEDEPEQNWEVTDYVEIEERKKNVPLEA
ncbi:A disintegrin and metalloproteinase with thrombospondin motifs adt-2-like [Pectinophora gossypiella]|uniref:A disintegrin and metalloproteinase with thrombospondin motifs adt-2-like n=1 Tax=Pectinophora gossypiella TaxID=13191 RepID=UPI00214E34B7|nr:A disintegrin and metalloproteinase with thrombospondin motifs adt-2-like [Pectinophora gossypiella]